MNKSEFKQKFDEMVNAAEKIYITSHEKPDDDAVSCALGVYYYITEYLKKSAELILTGEETDVWKERDKHNVIQWTPDFISIANQADLVIFLDGNEFTRFGKQTDKFDPKKTKTICIDHHPGEPSEFDLVFQDTSATAASQMVYELLLADEAISADVAEIILFGILGDTGNFRFIDHTRSRVLGIAEKLLNAGELDIQVMADTMSRISEKTFEAVKKFVNNTVNTTIEGVPPITYTFATFEDLKDLDMASSKAASGFYLFNFLRKIEDHSWGFVVRPESPTKYNISFRSSPNVVNVRELAMKFNGGGHVLAAGGEYIADSPDMTVQEVCQEILDVIAEMKEIIEV